MRRRSHGLWCSVINGLFRQQRKAAGPGHHFAYPCLEHLEERMVLSVTNNPPTVDPISDPAPIGEGAGKQMVSLTGITPGGGEVQQLQVTAVSSNPALIPDPTVSFAGNGLLAYYDFDGDADDRSGNNHHGTVMGATLTDDENDIPNMAYHFDGVDDFINLGNIADPVGSSGFSVAARARGDDLEVGSANVIFPILFKRKVVGRAFVPQFLLAFDTRGGSDKAEFFLGTQAPRPEPGELPDDGRVFVATLEGSITEDQWYHVTGTYDSGSQEMKIYLNGMLSSSAIIPALPNSPSPFEILIGKNTNGEHFDGAIDDVRIYDRSLSQEEVTAIVSSPPTTGSLHYTPVAGQSGTAVITVTVRDAGPNGTMGDADDATVQRSFTVTVVPPNQAPTVEDQGFAVDENAPNGTVVGTVVASDPDAGDTLSFAITGGTGATVFAVHPDTGAITVADSSQLDFEALTAFTLLVEVSDSGGLKDDATMTLDVNDVNEAPTLPAQSFGVDENSANGTVVGTVIASDPDAGDTLTFTIAGGTGVSTFAINPGTGVITVADSAQLNFESAPRFTLEVEVSDSGGLTDAITVNVDINDLNEAPVVINGLPDLTVNQNASSSQISLGDVFEDVDSGDAITLSITISNPGLLTLDLNGNNLTLDYSIFQSGAAVITVRATDNHGLYVEESFNVTVLSHQDQIQSVIDQLQAVIDTNPDSNVANQLEQVVNKLSSALNELQQTVPDRKTVLVRLKVAVGTLESVTHQGLISTTVGNEWMATLTGVAQRITTESIEKAISENGDQDAIQDALLLLSEADELFENNSFKDAIKKYRRALEEAEKALPS